ncbi:arylsulfatase [Leifsonia sp. NPDC077715]|uniref:arylsulfatase n=1 Tax=Leifsonia sp. NPDC077715 TaxID=3155539 RepID=UPI003432C1E9
MSAGDSLPFPPTPSASVAGRTLADSTYSPRIVPRRLSDDAPNILVVLIDDAGPGLPDTFGGEVHTPALTRVLENGIGFNRFHTTAMCSPTRASLLTGRNHHRIGNGQIAELANDWDGYAGEIPASSALCARVLAEYGYATAAFGKWHNTPALETSAAGPFHNWPSEQGFEYFYGFLAGEASQYEPNLVRNTTLVPPPKTAEEGYHLSADLADDAIHWLRNQRALQPDKPFFLYWASGCLHGPHQVMREWADKYAGRFDDGWDAYRERVFTRAKELGWIPPETELTPRDETMQAWEDVPTEERAFQTRLMEVAAGFAEYTDVQVGRLLDELDELGYGENTIVMYVWGDNGSSAEGQNGTISELLAQNGIPSTVPMHIAALDELGGLDALGTPKVENQYHSAWGWAGSTPYKGTKLLASHLGGTRNPLVISWPARVAPDQRPRAQFTHVVDVVPTIYELAGIAPPRTVDGVVQEPMDGVSFADALLDADAPAHHRTQYFEIMGSRAIYHDGWMASAFGPRIPWLPGLPPGIAEWTPDHDVWELYNLDEDWSQAHDLADAEPEKLAQLRELFAIEAAKNSVFPVGGGLWVPVFHPELRISSPYREWTFTGDIVRIPEFGAPALGNRANVVEIDATVPEDADGVLYSLGGTGGGLVCYLDGGHLVYEYNLFLIQRTVLRSERPVAPGPVKLTVETSVLEPRPASPLAITVREGDDELVSGVVPVSAPLIFTANDCLDIGRSLGGPVSPAFADRIPFAFTGAIDRVRIRYTS